MSLLTSILAPAPHIPRLPTAQIAQYFRKYRWQILESTFLGYLTFYFVRNNLAVVSKEMGAELGYGRSLMGTIIAATAISYGLGKFLLGAVSDRSNPRIFMAMGLFLTAICNIAFGLSSSYWLHMGLWTLNGFFQGAGWAPCGRSLGHWYAQKERGFIFGIWNISHNIGGGIVGVIAAWSAQNWGWRYAFFIPSAIAILCGFYLLLRLRDTPQSVGLPPIEEYLPELTNPQDPNVDPEKELGTYDLFVNHIFKNKWVWIFAFANFFAYIARYSLLDWGPTYLKEVKGASLTEGGISTFIYEFSGILSTIGIGWLSDRLDGRRGMLSLLCLIPILFAFLGIIFLPAGYLWVDLGLFAVIGFFIYPCILLLAVAGIDFTSKKAVGTAAGFIGLFGYLGRTVQGFLLGYLADHYGWNYSLAFIFICTLLGIFTLSFTWNTKAVR